jgi:hypothetical protein
MEGRQRRSFTEDYKRQAAELVVSSGRAITSVAKELGLRDSVLRRWVDKFRQEPTSAAWRPTTQATPMAASATAAPGSMPPCGTQGRGASRGRIERLMRRYGVRAITAPRRVRTTDSRQNLPIAPNLIARDFTAAAHGSYRTRN